MFELALWESGSAWWVALWLSALGAGLAYEAWEDRAVQLLPESVTPPAIPLVVTPKPPPAPKPRPEPALEPETLPTPGVLAFKFPAGKFSIATACAVLYRKQQNREVPGGDDEWAFFTTSEGFFCVYDGGYGATHVDAADAVTERIRAWEFGKHWHPDTWHLWTDAEKARLKEWL